MNICTGDDSFENVSNDSTMTSTAGSALKILSKRLTETYLKEIPVEDTIRYLRETNQAMELLEKTTVIQPPVVDVYDSGNILENDIKALKRRIKHSRNQMEINNYQRELNALYKRRKKKHN